MPIDIEGKLPAPEKTIVLETQNKTLDRLAGKVDPPVDEPKVQQNEPADDPKDEAKDDQNSIRTFPSDDDDKPKEEGKTEGNEDKGTPPADTPPVEEEEINLDEIVLEVDGEEKPVSELLNERDALAKRVAEIDNDPFLKGLIDHYKATGNIDAYYEAKGVDWDKKTDLEVVRAQFERENADLDKETLELLWEDKLSGIYKIRPDLSPEELESKAYKIGQGLLSRDAKNARAQFKEDQKKYQAPEVKKEEPNPAQQFDPAAYKQQILQDKNVQSFTKSKLLALGVKDSDGRTLGFEPKNPDQVIEMMTNDGRFWNLFVDPKTKQIDRVKQAKVYAFAQDPEFFEQSLVNLGRNLHLEEKLKENKQIDERLTRKTGGAPPKESFAKGFLGAALKQKK